MLYFWNRYEVPALENGTVNPICPRSNISFAALHLDENIRIQPRQLVGSEFDNLLHGHENYLRNVELSRRIQQHQLSTMLGVPVFSARRAAREDDTQNQSTGNTNSDRDIIFENNSSGRIRSTSLSGEGLDVINNGETVPVQLVTQAINPTVLPVENTPRSPSRLPSSNLTSPSRLSGGYVLPSRNLSSPLACEKFLSDRRKNVPKEMRFPNLFHNQKIKARRLSHDISPSDPVETPDFTVFGANLLDD